MIFVRTPRTPPLRSETLQRGLSDQRRKAEVRLPADQGRRQAPMMAVSDAVVG